MARQGVVRYVLEIEIIISTLSNNRTKSDALATSSNRRIQPENFMTNDDDRTSLENPLKSSDPDNARVGYDVKKPPRMGACPSFMPPECLEEAQGYL